MSSTPVDVTALPPTKRVAAGVLFVDPDDRMLLVEPAHGGPWELPGGAVEADESPYEAAIREVFDGLGLDVAPGRLLAVDWIPSAGAVSESMILVYDGGSLSPTQSAALRPSPDEWRGWAWCDPTEARQRLSSRLARRTISAHRARQDNATAYLEDGSPVA